MAPPLDITLMGVFTVALDGTPIAKARFGRPAAMRLLAYLALQQGEPVQRENILNDLWPDSLPAGAQGSFKSTLSLLRKALEPDAPPRTPSRFVLETAHTLALADARVDLHAFAQAARALLASAPEGDAALPNADTLSLVQAWRPVASDIARLPWAIEAAERNANIYLLVCLHLTHACADLGRMQDAVTWAERASEIAPWSEDAWRALIRFRAQAGDPTRALHDCGTALRALATELGAPPSEQLRWLAEQLRKAQEDRT
jgi:DNA-binding SARP family transcriptional activator